MPKGINCKEMTVTQIKEWFQERECCLSPEDFLTLAADPRKSIQNMVKRYETKLLQRKREENRLEEICFFEREMMQKGYQFIGGVDEVGRGPLAGPVVSAAVILPPETKIPDINDSKKLSAQKREYLFEIIQEKAISVGIGIVSVKDIDMLNILQATYMSMRHAVKQLNPQPQYLLLDAVHVPGLSIEQKGIVKGDQKSISIAAASIIAKVTRDRMMLEIDDAYPQYGFAKHKGYGTKQHLDALRKYGVCPIHRKSFAPVKDILNEQQSFEF